MLDLPIATIFHMFKKSDNTIDLFSRLNHSWKGCISFEQTRNGAGCYIDTYTFWRCQYSNCMYVFTECFRVETNKFLQFDATYCDAVLLFIQQASSWVWAEHLAGNRLHVASKMWKKNYADRESSWSWILSEWMKVELISSARLVYLLEGAETVWTQCLLFAQRLHELNR